MQQKHSTPKKVLGRRERVLLAKIRLDGETQLREQMDWDWVAHLREAFCLGHPIPPVEVCFDGQQYWLVDGFHRVAAAKKLRLLEINCVVWDETLDQARIDACHANYDHGLPRSNTTKRNAILFLLQHPLWRRRSDNDLAGQCRVSPYLVAKVRRELHLQARISANTENQSSDENTRVYSRNGKEVTINTANIGCRPAVSIAVPAVPTGRAKDPDQPLTRVCVEVAFPRDRDTILQRLQAFVESEGGTLEEIL